MLGSVGCSGGGSSCQGRNPATASATARLCASASWGGCSEGGSDLNSPLSGKDLNYFSAKGRSAEEFVHELATHTFFVDWCFPNPKRSDGKELCDLLVVFGSVAIVWQVKSLKLDEDGQPNQGEVEKNLRQTLGAKRYLLETRGTINLENARRRIKCFDFSTIQRVFLISALLCEPNTGPMVKHCDNGDYVHVMTGRFIELCLGELDTVRDFISYLEEKERFYNSGVSVAISGGEEELLAFYLLHDRSFSEFQGKARVLVDGGIWAGLHARPEYIAAQKANEMSHTWDHLIDETHNRMEEGAKYELIAREMASLTRFERRVASQAFVGALMSTLGHDLPRLSFRRVFTLEPDDHRLRSDITFCFLFHDVPNPRDSQSGYDKERQSRVGELEAMLYVTRCRIDKPVVVGIATEPMVDSPGRSFDFELLQMPVVSSEWRASAEDVARRTGMLVDPRWISGHSDEYPSVEDQR
jgi:hypothetical protein